MSWADQIQFARGLPTRWDLNLIADVMEEISTDWEGVLEAHMGIAGASFWQLGEDWPRHEVRVVLAPAGRPKEDDPVFEFLYFGDTGFNSVTTADRCRSDNAPAVLTAFLYNLALPNIHREETVHDAPTQQSQS